MLEVLIEIARGLASLWVFLFHLRPDGAHSAFWTFGALGDLGVPAFFVISGLCIYASAISTIASGRTASSFLRRRLKRIFPPFWAAVAVAVAVPYVQAALIGLHGHRWQPPHPLWQAYSAVDWLLLLSLCRVFCSHGRSLDTAFTAVNAVYWSLAIEVQFYLVVALALYWRRHFYRILLAVTVAGCASLSVPALRTSGVFLPYWPMFALGGGLFVVMRRVSKAAKPALGVRLLLMAFSAAALWIVCAAYARHALGIQSIGYYTLFAAGFTLLLASLAPMEALLQRHRGALGMRALLALGSASYSLYLVHAVVMHIPWTMVWMVAGPAVAPGSLLWSLVIIGPTVLFAYGFSVLCERPFISARSSSAAKARVPAGRAAASGAD